MRETRCNFVCCNFGAGDLWWQVQSRRGDVRSVWEDGMHVPELAGSVRIDRLARFGGGGNATAIDKEMGQEVDGCKSARGQAMALA